MEDGRGNRERQLGRRVKRILRVVGRGPGLLYDLRLGGLVGDGFLLLTHRGRRTGKRYRTFLKVIGVDRGTGTLYVLSTWGPSDWFRNALASPSVIVQVGRGVYSARGRSVTAAEAATRLKAFRRRHVWLWLLGSAITRRLTGVDLITRPVVAFTPATGNAVSE